MEDHGLHKNLKLIKFGSRRRTSIFHLKALFRVGLCCSCLLDCYCCCFVFVVVFVVDDDFCVCGVGGGGGWVGVSFGIFYSFT